MKHTSFQDVFWKFSSGCLPSAGQIQRETKKKTVFLVFPSLKDFGGFKDRPERCHDVRWYRENLRTRKSIQKWRIFGWFLAQKKKTKQKH